MKAFLVKGHFADPRKEQPFSVELAAADEAAAKEKILSEIGSRHKMKRWQITVTSIEEIPADKVESHLVKYQIGA